MLLGVSHCHTAVLCQRPGHGAGCQACDGLILDTTPGTQIDKLGAKSVISLALRVGFCALPSLPLSWPCTWERAVQGAGQCSREAVRPESQLGPNHVPLAP